MSEKKIGEGSKKEIEDTIKRIDRELTQKDRDYSYQPSKLDAESGSIQ